MGLTRWSIVWMVMFWTFSRIAAEPGLRSKSIQEDLQAQPKVKIQEEDSKREKREQQLDTASIIQVSGRSLPVGRALPTPVDRPKFYHAPCNHTADCFFGDSNAMDCTDGICECVVFENHRLRYLPDAKQCLGDKDHTCWHNSMCYSRECIKVVIGPYSDGEIVGKCTAGSSRIHGTVFILSGLWSLHFFMWIL